MLFNKFIILQQHPTFPRKDSGISTKNSAAMIFKPVHYLGHLFLTHSIPSVGCRVNSRPPTFDRIFELNKKLIVNYSKHTVTLVARRDGGIHAPTPYPGFIRCRVLIPIFQFTLLSIRLPSFYNKSFWRKVRRSFLGNATRNSQAN